MLSVIMPVFNEAKNLEGILSDLRAICPAAEVIVVDGGSEDGTSALVRQFPWVTYLSGRRGRASQMNAGAAVANGEVLLFLHADTLLPAGANAAILEAFLTIRKLWRDASMSGSIIPVRSSRSSPSSSTSGLV